MAIVVSPNTNLTSSDAWAMVSKGFVVNTILASVNDIYEALNMGPNMYTAVDYLVDLTIQDQYGVSIGWAYNPGGNTFIPPAPPVINWVDVTNGDFGGVMQGLIQVVFDAGAQGGLLTPQQITTAYQAALEDTQTHFTPNQLVLMGDT